MKIVLGVTGGIAAYKAAEIVRSLRREGCEVTVIMTRNASEFITPLTLQVLSGRPVVSGQFDLSRGADIEHISLVRDSDLLLVAPATADMIAKFARGVADDFLSTFYTAFTGPVLVAPAMNSRMWAHASVRQNLGLLRARGVGVVEPVAGELACGEEGMGRLAPSETVVAAALRMARRGRSLSGESVLVTAGPTREPIDPVRFLSNRSSGRMGYALAEAARRRGAAVTLVSGPVALPDPWGVEVLRVETAAEMAAEVRKRFPSSTLCFMVAAVADFRPERVPAKKIRRQDGPAGGARTLRLEPTEDIVASLATVRSKGQVLVGFAAETGDAEAAARRKLKAKGLDAIFANDVSRPGEGFDVETNALIGLSADGRRREFPLASKEEISEGVLDWIEELRGSPARTAGRRGDGGSRSARPSRAGARRAARGRSRPARAGGSGGRRP